MVQANQIEVGNGDLVDSVALSVVAEAAAEQKGEEPKSPREVPFEEIKFTPVFRNRFSYYDVVVGGVTFVLRPLSTFMENHCEQESVDPLTGDVNRVTLANWFVRCGLVKIVGMEDEDGNDHELQTEPLQFQGRPEPDNVATWAEIDGLGNSVVSQLFMHMLKINAFSAKEIKRLGFASPSQHMTSTASEAVKTAMAAKG